MRFGEVSHRRDGEWFLGQRGLESTALLVVAVTGESSPWQPEQFPKAMLTPRLLPGQLRGGQRLELISSDPNDATARPLSCSLQPQGQVHRRSRHKIYYWVPKRTPGKALPCGGANRNLSELKNGEDGKNFMFLTTLLRKRKQEKKNL